MMSINELVIAAANGYGQCLLRHDLEVRLDNKTKSLLYEVEESLDFNYYPDFPPVKVYKEGDYHELRDGYHRVGVCAYAAWELGSNQYEIPVEFVDVDFFAED